jgi:hypothetical protein
VCHVPINLYASHASRCMTINLFLGECERTKDFVKCDVCHDAVLENQLESHKNESHCRELTSGIAKCPLCTENVYLPDDGGYQRHIKIGCPAQKRKFN